MAFFEEIGKTLTKVGEATAQKTKEVAEITKANAKKLDIQNKLDKAYAEVGKKYVALHPVNDEEGMKKVVDAVYALEDQLKELEKQLHDLKGTVKCENCGTQCDAEASYCSSCGAELHKAEIIIDAEEVKPEETAPEAEAEEAAEAVEEEAAEPETAEEAEPEVAAEDIEESVE